MSIFSGITKAFTQVTQKVNNSVKNFATSVANKSGDAIRHIGKTKLVKFVYDSAVRLPAGVVATGLNVGLGTNLSVNYDTKVGAFMGKYAQGANAMISGMAVKFASGVSAGYTDKLRGFSQNTFAKKMGSTSEDGSILSAEDQSSLEVNDGSEYAQSYAGGYDPYAQAMLQTRDTPRESEMAQVMTSQLSADQLPISMQNKYVVGGAAAVDGSVTENIYNFLVS